MLKRTIQNNDIFNKTFAENDFSFVYNVNNDLNELSDKISAQTRKQEVLTQLKEKLEAGVENKYVQAKSEIFDDLTNMLSLIEQNINIFSEIKKDMENIDAQIFELLNSIKENGKTQNVNSDSTKQIKNNIAVYSARLNDTKSKIYLNDIKIDNFLKKESVENYLKEFDIAILEKLTDNLTDESEMSVNMQDEAKSLDPQKNIRNNNVLLISEKFGKVFLPYTMAEINDYLEQYPKEYSSASDVISREFILSLDYYVHQPIIARFREAYSLIRDKEAKSFFEAVKFALDIMFNFNLNPVIIAACKSQDQLEHYLTCLTQNKLNEFKDFKIKFEVNPSNVIV